jgi:3D (Asp-Asp-Asp) domain-containing protein
MKNNLKEIAISFLIVFGCIYSLKTITITTPAKKVAEIKPKPHKKKHSDTIVVTATMYNAVKKQCDSNPFETANGSIINPKKASEHKWIAMSRDLLKRWKGKFNYGDKVKLIGAKYKDGVYTIVDCMNKRFTKKIDILETEGVDEYKFENVKIVAL